MVNHVYDGCRYFGGEVGGGREGVGLVLSGWVVGDCLWCVVGGGDYDGFVGCVVGEVVGYICIGDGFVGLVVFDVMFNFVLNCWWEGYGFGLSWVFWSVFVVFVLCSFLCCFNCCVLC